MISIKELLLEDDCVALLKDTYYNMLNKCVYGPANIYDILTNYQELVRRHYRFDGKHWYFRRIQRPLRYNKERKYWEVDIVFYGGHQWRKLEIPKVNGKNIYPPLQHIPEDWWFYCA